MNVNIQQIKEVLNALSEYRCDDREQWIRVGMAIHAATDGASEGLEMWDSWSARSQKYRQGECPRIWKGFATSGKVSVGTLFYMAKEDGHNRMDFWDVPSESSGKRLNYRQAGNTARAFRNPRECLGYLNRRHGSPAAVWEYQNSKWEPVGYAVRFNRADRGKFIIPMAFCEDGLWRNQAMPEPRLLYRLPEIFEQDITETIYVVEGEKCADSMVSIDLMATTSPGGSSAAGKADWTALAGRKVVIIPDNDLSGQKYAGQISSILLSLNPPAKVRILQLPDMPEKGDVYDFILSRIGAEAGNEF